MRVSYSQNLDAPLADAWAVVRDFGSLLKWVRGGSEGSIRLTGDGVGMLRDLVLPAVGSVQHRLDELDDDAHRITYSLTAGKPLGMAEYSVSATLIERNGPGCTIEWAGEFNAEPGAALDEMAAGLENAYEGMSTLLNELLVGRRSEKEGS